MSRLIAITGHSRSGKDQTAHFLVKNHGFRRWAFADSLRYVLEGVTEALRPDIYWYVVEGGWDGAKKPYPEVVSAMIELGSRVREIDANFWVKASPSWVTDGSTKVVVPDLRFVNELDMVRKNGGQVWKIVRPGTTPRGMDTMLDHLSDSDWDCVLNNSGTLEDLEKLVNRGMQEGGRLTAVDVLLTVAN